MCVRAKDGVRCAREKHIYDDFLAIFDSFLVSQFTYVARCGDKPLKKLEIYECKMTCRQCRQNKKMANEKRRLFAHGFRNAGVSRAESINTSYERNVLLQLFQVLPPATE